MHRIYDAVYGYIELEDVEFNLVNSPLFQRLHWIKQLGPLSIVFPSASHSRFSHSIGVFHIVKKMIEQLKKSNDKFIKSFFEGISDKDWIILRLRLLHLLMENEVEKN